MSVSFPPSTNADSTIEFQKADGTKLPIKITKRETDEVIYGLAIKYIGTTAVAGDQFEISIQTVRKSVSTMKVSCIGAHRFDVGVQDEYIRIITHEAEDGVATCKYFDRSTCRFLDENQVQPNKPRMRLPKEIRSLIAKAKTESFHLGEIPLRKILAGKNIVILYCAEDNSRAIYAAKKADREFVKCSAALMKSCRCLQRDMEWLVQLPNESGTHELKFALGEVSTHPDFQDSWDQELLEAQKL